ncbi:hypothetical protein F383_36194 [Gossypium arboreum]|uniref:Uncharacterized protein n=1 Tax=Gossypium arboreum TaxID=29729 RepID=A0A0B0PYN4_GOSAR|nr:hypothetical protein F383_22488 [Gossypium arboreum]KHG29609.1 hypothetical protein F383_36194 [Gossypium arboreum]
MCCREGFSSDG